MTRQVGTTEQDEIEITQAMVDAGVGALADNNPCGDNGEQDHVAVAAIFKSMWIELALRREGLPHLQTKAAKIVD